MPATATRSRTSSKAAPAPKKKAPPEPVGPRLSARYSHVMKPHRVTSLIVSTEWKGKSRLLAFLLCLLLGPLGVHRHYVGKFGTGILQLLTAGGLGLWWLLDLVMILAGKFKDVRGDVVDSWLGERICEVDGGLVVVRPVIPGALVSPTEQRLELVPRRQVAFFVTPLAKGELPRARVDVFAPGQPPATIPLGIAVKTQRLALFLVFLAFALPYFLYQASKGSFTEDLTKDQSGVPDLAGVVNRGLSQDLPPIPIFNRPLASLPKGLNEISIAKGLGDALGKVHGLLMKHLGSEYRIDDESCDSIMRSKGMSPELLARVRAVNRQQLFQNAQDFEKALNMNPNDRGSYQLTLNVLYVKLRDLRDKRFLTPVGFKRELAARLTPEELDEFQPLLLKHAEVPVKYKVTPAALDALKQGKVPPAALARLNDKKGESFDTRQELDLVVNNALTGDIDRITHIQQVRNATAVRNLGWILNVLCLGLLSLAFLTWMYNTPKRALSVGALKATADDAAADEAEEAPSTLEPI